MGDSEFLQYVRDALTTSRHMDNEERNALIGKVVAVSLLSLTLPFVIYKTLTYINKKPDLADLPAAVQLIDNPDPVVRQVEVRNGKCEVSLTGNVPPQDLNEVNQLTALDDVVIAFETVADDGFQSYTVPEGMTVQRNGEADFALAHCYPGGATLPGPEELKDDLVSRVEFPKNYLVK